MIVYVDTSALLKLLIDEPGSDVMLAVAAESPTAASSALTEVEARAALARMSAAGRLPKRSHAAAVRRFEELWENVAALAVERPVLREGVRLAEARRLRGYDAVQLASALEVGPPPEITFACFDAELREAAAAEGFPLSPP